MLDPNMGGTVKFEWGWVKLVPAWHTSTTPKGTANTPAGLLINFQDTIDLPPRRHLRVLRPAARRQAPPDRRRADVHRRPLHDGSRRRGRRGRADRGQDRDPVPLQHVPADRDRRAGVQVRRGVGHAARTSSCSTPDSRTRRDPRDRPDPGGPLGAGHAGRRAGRPRGRGRGVLGDRRVGLRRDAAPAPARGPRAGGHGPDLPALGRGADAHDGGVRGLLASTTSRRCSPSVSR